MESRNQTFKESETLKVGDLILQNHPSGVE
jgi:hypothetical protein